MNKHVMVIAVYLALQPVASSGAETMIQPGVKERDNKQSFEIQRDRAVPEHVAKSCIPMRPGNPNGVASQEANKPGGVRNDCEPMTQPRGRAPKVTVAQDSTKGVVPGAGDAIERGKRRAESTRERNKQGCISFSAANPNGVANGASSKPPPTQGQKPGSVRNDCEPMTEPRATQDATRLIYTFPDGKKPYADRHEKGIQKHSALDQRGRELKEASVQNASRGVVPMLGDAIEHGNQRAESTRERQRANFEKAIQNAVYGSWDKCLVKLMADDGEVFWHDGGCKR